MTLNSIEARMQEIGIRRVLGAGTGQVFYLLGREIGFPILVSLVIGLPVAWIVNQAWLQEFPYRVSPGVTVFALGAGIIIFITTAIVAPVVFRAARINPVRVIRHQ